MALMTLERFKELLDIQDTSYDAQFAIYEPIAESRLNCYLGYTLEELALGYEPHYARLIYTTIGEGSITVSTTGDVKSESFDGASFSYGDKTGKEVAATSAEALSKFYPLKKKVW